MQLKTVFFYSLPISKKNYADLQSLINHTTLSHCHSGFYSELKLEQEILHVSGCSYIPNKCLCFHICLKAIKVIPLKVTQSYYRAAVAQRVPGS